MKRRVVVLTGAGISAESGLRTFRDSGGLWEGFRVEDVATPEAWKRNPALVLQFYNDRRKSLVAAEPNPAHFALVKLEDCFDVRVITQNVDNLHERAGSSNVLHQHGDLMKARSTSDTRLICDIKGTDLNLGDRCEKGSQLRPHIVWFGEAVPMMDEAIEVTRRAEILIVVGTSLVVYPAAGLIEYVSEGCPVHVVDPKRPGVQVRNQVEYIEEKASIGVPALVEKLLRSQ